MQLEKVYGEIFRVLKPGCKFVSYEWVSLPDYDPNNKEHATIIQEISLRNGLPVKLGWSASERWIDLSSSSALFVTPLVGFVIFWHVLLICLFVIVVCSHAFVMCVPACFGALLACFRALLACFRDLLPCFMIYLRTIMIHWRASGFSCVHSLSACVLSCFACVLSSFACALSCFACALSWFACALSWFTCVLSWFSCVRSCFTCVLSWFACCKFGTKAAFHNFFQLFLFPAPVTNSNDSLLLSVHFYPLPLVATLSCSFSWFAVFIPVSFSR